MKTRYIELINRFPIKMWTDMVEDDSPTQDKAIAQLDNLSNMPFIFKHLAVMPDVHPGKGSTIGTVIPTKGAIIPAAVGVDIGCGMMWRATSLTASDLPDNLNAIRSAIEAAVPHGRSHDGGADDIGSWGVVPEYIDDLFAVELDTVRFRSLCEKYPRLDHKRMVHQFGTLGTGNHFIELCLDEMNRVSIMLHSGSRGVGASIGAHFIGLAKKEMERFFINLPDKDLAYLPEGTEHFDDYVAAMLWAQRYAELSREIMMENVIYAIAPFVPDFHVLPDTAINCHHNYATKERHFGEDVWVTRKGAVRARGGDLGIIPGSMGDESYIVRGLGNRDSFHSCSHGAGRKMSRTEARKTFTVDDLAVATAGVECDKTTGVLDEIPYSYKDINQVMASQSDLVEVVHTLRQIVNVKGVGE